MRIKNIQTFAYVYTLMLAVSGCTSDDPPVLVPLETSVIRAYQEGDSVAARMSISNTANGRAAVGNITVAVGGTVTNPFGVDCRVFQYSGSLTGPSGTESISTISLYYQDVDNSIYYCGSFDETLGRYVFLTDTVTSPNGLFLERKSPMAIGNSSSGKIFRDDGTWRDCTMTVQDKADVTVPLGLYESYLVLDTCLYSDGSNYVSTLWEVPSIFSIKESSKLYDMGEFDVEIEVTGFHFE